MVCIIAGTRTRQTASVLPVEASQKDVLDPGQADLCVAIYYDEILSKSSFYQDGAFQCTCLVFGAKTLGALSAVEEKSLLIEENEQRWGGISRRCAQHLCIDLHPLFLRLRVQVCQHDST